MKESAAFFREQNLVTLQEVCWKVLTVHTQIDDYTIYRNRDSTQSWVLL